MNEDGKMTRKLKWDPSCPLAALEFVFQNQLEEDQPKRCYPAFIEKSSSGPARLGARNIGDPSQAAVDFMRSQGLPRFDTNSGRQSLARWCKKLNVPYELSVHLHGDLHACWNKHYETEVVQMKSKQVIRKQSRDPQVATAALRIFADFLERGFDPYQRPMSLLERQNDMLLRVMAGPAVAARIRMGLDAYDASQDAGAIEAKVTDATQDAGAIDATVTDATQQERFVAIAVADAASRKRKRPAEDVNKYSFKLEDIDSDEDLREYLKPMPRKKRKKKSKGKPKSKRPAPTPKKKKKKSQKKKRN